MSVQKGACYRESGPNQIVNDMKSGEELANSTKESLEISFDSKQINLNFNPLSSVITEPIDRYYSNTIFILCCHIVVKMKQKLLWAAPAMQ